MQTLHILHVVGNGELLLAFYFILIHSQVMVTGMVIVLVIVSGTTMETQTETTTSTHRVSNRFLAHQGDYFAKLRAALAYLHMES